MKHSCSVIIALLIAAFFSATVFADDSTPPPAAPAGDAAQVDTNGMQTPPADDAAPVDTGSAQYQPAPILSDTPAPKPPSRAEMRGRVQQYKNDLATTPDTVK